MGERTSYSPGTFCWTDLVTADPDAAGVFYGDVLGWQLEEIPRTGFSLARVGGRAVGAIGPLPDPSQSPRFNCYVSVESVDASAARGRELGGEILLAPGDIGALGRLAVVADREGAALSLWQPGELAGAEVVNVPGALTWNDLATTDIDDAEAFYGGLFGWTLEAASDDPPYTVIHTADGGANGGIMAAAEGQPPVWVPYFATDEIAEACARAEEAGAAVVNGPADVPAGTFAVLQDPQGAAFCLFSSGDFDD